MATSLGRNIYNYIEGSGDYGSFSLAPPGGFMVAQKG